MSHLDKLKHKIFSLQELKAQVTIWKQYGEEIVFTNGCFDIIHKGHIEVLARTADLGSRLIVGLNSDISIKKIKGVKRPILNEQSRALILASFSFVDAVILFAEDTPKELISHLIPDILAKGGDYEIESVVGHEIVQNSGGIVKLVPYIEGYSSTNIINKIRNC
tara:strand:+ start:1207 stop:1698 length:492 start_codon:yes stop_codon:yes gene_type:complete